ncbi:Erd1p NDAI_0A04130 [Naumovozyma dairenensis CBS 421]|uniref:EXS domain-containing protein n=1 Tax=Naumovozyma dairenensis (strain ATCC 10597 / BCRC 20456 / CBS 421 / NBRC 0211 / NRRL Y-12639) TaxID=1071378 RepID=G0W432_NAUDC|nr:hypothetical protein NDAI_0A04130 [Naumovozyma dairenensis CBS 421]CCD22570.1 hypothetical protein NDAI_0A04130 [Naumovozyma dairenensis CBS 421]
MENKEITIQSVPFSTVLIPPPLRLNILLLSAIWLWFSILNFLSRYQVDVSSIVRIRDPHDMHIAPTHYQLQTNARNFATSLTKIILPLHLISSILYYIFSQQTEVSNNNVPFNLLIHSLPLVGLIIISTTIIRHVPIIKYCVKRLILIESKPRNLRTTYILLSDSLTSIAKPLIDFTLFTSLLISEPITHFDLFIASLPVLIRIFQCLREYYIAGNKSMLANAMKYCCNLPILICTWYSRVHDSKMIKKNYELTFLLINSSYSFFWDVRMDWLLDNIINGKLRRSKIVMPEFVYQVAIFIDFIIRYWWVWIRLYGGNSGYIFIFFDGELQYLEVLRRAIWVVFKLESEYVINLFPK